MSFLGLGEIMLQWIGLLLMAVLVTSCTSQQNNSILENYVGLDADLPRSIGDLKQSFTIVKMNLSDNTPSLIVGYPRQLIGQQTLFGGTIIEVSATQDESLGSLKMGSLPPFQVRMQLQTEASGQLSVLLKGCQEKCNERSPQVTVAHFPVVRVDEKDDLAYLDLSALGAQLDILKYFSGESEDDAPLPWTFISSVTRSFDYSLSTLVFDVVSKYQLKEKETTKEFSVTTRWYLRLASVGTPFFKPRPSTPEIGFFKTERNESNVITRFRTPTADTGPIKYYIKNVPAEYRAGFSEAVEAWNQKMAPVIGTRFLDYGFLEASDPRSQAIVTGDIRYNVIEWDLVNVAGYGGLGPSISLQDTGEVLAGQVLVQGPQIEKLYKAWFNVKNDKDASHLAQQLVKKTSPRHQLELNGVKFFIPSQDPKLHDSADSRMDFSMPPPGYDYPTYMRNYFRDMVAHELGHNFGLAHNFRGNLADNNSHQMGSVSRSVMEYLNADYRHLDTVGEYDIMAISYGYLGVLPAHADWYCSDAESDINPKYSAECSSEDASSDPYGFFVNKLREIMKKAVAWGRDQKPDWTPEQLSRHIKIAVPGLARYATSAAFTAKKWTNFNLIPGRPTSEVDIPAFVIKDMSGIICQADWDRAINGKSSDADKLATQENLVAVRALMALQLQNFDKPFSLAMPQYFPCLEFKPKTEKPAKP
jgi:hypothetical protein